MLSVWADEPYLGLFGCVWDDERWVQMSPATHHIMQYGILRMASVSDTPILSKGSWLTWY